MSFSKYQTVLFDWDGCLAQTLDVWMQAYQFTFEKFGLSPSRREIGAYFGDWRADVHLGVSELAHEEFLEILEAEVTLGLPDVQLYPGAASLVEDLFDARIKLALITSSPEARLMQALDNLHIGKFFSAVVTAESVEHHKPHAEPIEKALALLDVDKSGAVMIGDSDKDLGAANNAGIDSVLFHDSDHALYYDIDALLGFNPTHVCSSFTEVDTVLRER